MSTYDSVRFDWTRVNLRNLIAVYSEGVVYVIYIYERKVGLKEIPKAFTIPEGAPSRDINVGGIRGIEYGPENGNNRIQFFVNGSYLYQFVTRSVSREKPDAGVARFFGSIKFERTQTDRAILEGPGEAPAQDSSTLETTKEDRVMTGKEVDKKAIVVTKPEPSYTDAARQNQVTGTVVLRAVFSFSGAMTGVRLVSGLPHGLSERAIAAARQIKFIPAVKDGHFVSMHIQLEYSFNLY